MKGQWQGLFNGYSTGQITLDIDEYKNNYSGRACIFEASNTPLIYVISFSTVDKNNIQRFSLPIQFQQIADTNELSRDEIQKRFPHAQFPDRADITITKTTKGLAVSATTFLGLQKIGNLQAKLDSGSSERKSKLKPDKKVISWEKFKIMVGRLQPDKYIFRGQPVLNRLRTSFHRTNRRDLYRFMRVDIPVLHGIVTSKTKHYFELRDDLQNAAFWNLLQHHGYPTPLLDWTHSPYVAAYFAFRERLIEPLENRKIRIFMFDRAQWEKDYNQIYSVVNVKPHFSILNPIALENPRALPQQAVCSITTVDDVEQYLIGRGADLNRTYLTVFELPYSERRTVLAELRLMGVTAGSLFPGIDGACEEMRLKNFGT